jgi:Spy/CpxP family protein refolding chaperone
MHQILGVATALALAAAPALAQHQEHGTGQPLGMQGMQGMQDDMAAMHLKAFQPDQLLAKQADLKLTVDQVTRLERIAADAKSKQDQAKTAHEQHKQQLMEALMADTPSTDAVGAHFRAAHEAMGAAHWAELESGLAAMAVLTPEQRATVKSSGHGMECCKKP